MKLFQTFTHFLWPGKSTWLSLPVRYRAAHQAAAAAGGTAIISVDDRLRGIESKAEEWHSLGAERKLQYLQHAANAMGTVLPLLRESSETYTRELRRIEANQQEDVDQEYELYATLDTAFQVFAAKGIIDAYLQAFQVQAGTNGNFDVLTNLETRTTASGRVVAKVFPLTLADKMDRDFRCAGEVYFDPKTSGPIQPFRVKELQENKAGLCVVLGAGNYPMLTLSDVIYQMFQKNQVVFCKLHELRGSFDKVMRHLFQPLYDDGFLDSELHQSLDRSSELVYNPRVSSVHMTGGKATHDKIVWGATAQEQQQRIRERDPKLKAYMSSELGAVTPYIVTPANFSNRELDHQAKVLASCKWVNGGASCNAPQVVIMSSEWAQREEFVNKVERHWKSMYAPCVYYPGSQDRVDAFAQQYPTQSSQWLGRLPANHSDLHMPLLVVQMDVDVSTREGIEAAAKEYAFSNEAFGPVLVFATLKVQPSDEDVKTPDDFLDKAVTLCNDHLFGTLSCSLMVHDKMQTDACVQKAVERLNYGGIAFNTWSSVALTIVTGVWGGSPHTETKERAESGVGHVNNALFLKGVEKFVVRKPVIDEVGNVILTRSRKSVIRLYDAVPKFMLKPGINTLARVVTAFFGPAAYVHPIGLVAAAAVARWLLIRR